MKKTTLRTAVTLTALAAAATVLGACEMWNGMTGQSSSSKNTTSDQTYRNSDGSYRAADGSYRAADGSYRNADGSYRSTNTSTHYNTPPLDPTVDAYKP